MQAELVFTANIRIANLPLTFGDGRGHILAKTTDTVILEALTHVRFDQNEDFTIAALDVSKVNWKAVRPRKATVWVTESVPGFYKVYGKLILLSFSLLSYMLIALHSSLLLPNWHLASSSSSALLSNHPHPFPIPCSLLFLNPSFSLFRCRYIRNHLLVPQCF